MATVATNPTLDARIAAAPDDPEAYLVYADWLQARGDPRGELITIQAALAERPGDFDLIRAESRLIHGHPGHFLPEDLLDLNNVEWQWRLGFLRRTSLFGNQAALETLLAHPSTRFLEELRCDEWLAGEALSRCLASLAPRQTFKSLSIDSSQATPVPIGFLRGCPMLEELELGHVAFPLDTLEHPRLARVTLRSHFEDFDLGPLLDAAKTPSLAELTLRGGSADQLTSLVGTKLLAGLRRLTFRECGLRDQDARIILDNAADFSHLEHLGLHGNSFDRTEPALTALGEWVVPGYQHFDPTLLYE